MLENIFLLKRKWIKVHGNNRPGVAWPYELSPLSVRVRLSSGYACVDTTHTRLRKICMSDLLTPFFSTDTLCKVHFASQTGYAPGGVNPHSSLAVCVCYTLTGTSGSFN